MNCEDTIDEFEVPQTLKFKRRNKELEKQKENQEKLERERQNSEAKKTDQEKIVDEFLKD